MAEPKEKPSFRRSSVFEPHKRISHNASSVTEFSCEPTEDVRGRKTAFENTYQMEPPCKFRVDLVSDMMQDILAASLRRVDYDAILCANLSKNIAQDIKVKVKEMEFKRYKLVSVVTIGEKKGQGVRVGSRCVWDSERDNFASASFENTSLFATAVVYALYYE